MTFRQYLLVMFLGTAAAVIAWVIVFLSIDPAVAGLPAAIIFLFTFFVALVGVLSLLGTLTRVLVIHRDRLVSREVMHAFRQAVLIGLIVLATLLLSANEYLRWWTLLLTIGFFSLVEFFFITLNQGRS